MSDVRSFEIRFSRHQTTGQLVAALRAVHGLLPSPWRRVVFGSPSLILELRADASGTSHVLVVPESRSTFVLGQLRGALPGIRITETDLPSAQVALGRELVPVGPGQLRTDDAESSNAAVLAALQPLGDREAVIIQWAITPVGNGSFRWVRELAQRLWAQPEEIQRPEEPHFLAVGRLGVRSPDPGSLIARLIGAIATASTEDRRLRRRFLPSWVVARRMVRRTPGTVPYPRTLAADELAAVLGVPIKGPQLRGLNYVESRDLPPRPAVRRRGRVLGETLDGRAVALSEDASRRGLLITAPTGAGKSTLLERLCAQDFEAGRPVVVIESKGDLVDALADLVPESRCDDVLIFNPADRSPVGFNLLTGDPESTDLLVDHVVSQFKQLYAAYLGPRSEMLLRASLATLTNASEPFTICEVVPLLSDPRFRRRLLAQQSDHVLAGIWAWFDEQTPAAQAEMVSPLVNKLAAFTLRRNVRAVVGQAEAPLDFSRALAERQIVLISLAKGQVGEDAASLLGSVLLARLWAAIQARSNVAPGERHFVSVVLDEAQDFLRLPVALGDAVAQSRGLGVGWTVAHQHLGQLTPELRQAVLANLRSKVVFQTTSDDARAFSREFAPHVEAADLQGLEAYEAYASIATGASVAPPALIRTFPPPQPAGHGDVIRTRSRARYGVPADQVNRAIEARLEGQRPTAPVGARRRP